MIRLGNFSDFSRVNKLFILVKAELRESGIDIWNDGYPSVTDFKEDLENNLCLVYELEEEIIGYIAFREKLDDGNFLESFKQNVSTLYLSRIMTDPNHRNKKIIKKMFEYLFVMRREEAYRIFVSQHNQRAISVYKKIGFAEIGQYSFAFGNFLIYEFISKLYFKNAFTSDTIVIEEIGRNIWNECYKTILKKEQIDFMLEKFQSRNALLSQIDNGYSYYLVFYGESSVGYFGYKITGKEMFLSKLYLKKEARGKNIASLVFNFLENLDISKISLTVNRYNTHAYELYLKKGFVVDEVKDVAIGNGFFMEDYYMSKKLF